MSAHYELELWCRQSPVTGSLSAVWQQPRSVSHLISNCNVMPQECPPVHVPSLQLPSRRWPGPETCRGHARRVAADPTVMRNAHKYGREYGCKHADCGYGLQLAEFLQDAPLTALITEELRSRAQQVIYWRKASSAALAEARAQAPEALVRGIRAEALPLHTLACMPRVLPQWLWRRARSVTARAASAGSWCLIIRWPH